LSIKGKIGWLGLVPLSPQTEYTMQQKS